MSRHDNTQQQHTTVTALGAAAACSSLCALEREPSSCPHHHVIVEGRARVELCLQAALEQQMQPVRKACRSCCCCVLPA
jgi:hypothetical protein